MFFTFFVTGAKREKKPIFYQLFYAWKFQTLFSFYPLSYLSLLPSDLICRDTVSVRPVASLQCVLVSFCSAEMGLVGQRETCCPKSTHPFLSVSKLQERGVHLTLLPEIHDFPLGCCPESAEQLHIALDLPQKNTTTLWSKATVLLTVWESSFPLLKCRCLLRGTQHLFYDKIVWENYFC